MSTYMTKQRRTLLDFLYHHHDQVFSTQQLAKALAGEQISQSAIYRNLTALEQDNKVRRHVKAGTNEVYYQYINPDVCKGQIHLTCTRCSHSIHMNLDDATLLVNGIADKDGFAIDRDNTVIYGICKQCQNA